MAKLNARLIVGGACTAHDASLLMYEAMSESIAKDTEARVAVTRIYYIMRSGDVRLWSPTPDIDLPQVDQLQAGRSLTAGEFLADIATADGFVFSLLQGTDGEDGVYQGVLKVTNALSNLGPVFPAALSRHKWSQSLAAEHLCPDLTPIRTVRLRPDAKDEYLAKAVDYFQAGDVVVKPNDLGGSVHTRILQGVSVEALREYLQVARDFADEFLVQARIVGDEYTVGCMRVNGKTVVLPVARVEVDSGFLGFTEKWSDVGFGVKTLPLDHKVSKRLGSISTKLFDEIGFGSACRFDFIVANDAVYFLEANSKPGLCSDSFFTIMLAEIGVTLCDFLMLCHADASLQWQRRTLIDYQEEFAREATERAGSRPTTPNIANGSSLDAII